MRGRCSGGSSSGTPPRGASRSPPFPCKVGVSPAFAGRGERMRRQFYRALGGAALMLLQACGGASQSAATPAAEAPPAGAMAEMAPSAPSRQADADGAADLKDV